MGVNLLMIVWLRIRVDCLIVYLALDWASFWTRGSDSYILHLHCV
jgi:hypothetical protein